LHPDCTQNDITENLFDGSWGGRSDQVKRVRFLNTNTYGETQSPARYVRLLRIVLTKIIRPFWGGESDEPNGTYSQCGCRGLDTGFSTGCLGGQ
jgi:hypothetical protein